MSRCDVPWNDDAYEGRNTFMTVRVEADRALSNTESDLNMLHGRIMEAIRQSLFDFRTVESLGRELGVPEDILRRELADLEKFGALRRPVIPDAKYDDWYRDTKRGLTRQEKWARWRALITFQSMRDDF